MLLLSLFATAPALVCAQEAKLINCRSLDAAGNFVGPDEVVVDDLVCQKVKSGATAAAAPSKPEPPKPLPGAVISGEEPPNVVDAAKASSKRVAAAVQANAEKSAAASEPAAGPPPTPAETAAAPDSTTSSPAPENSEPPPMSVAEAARANAKRMAETEIVTEKPAKAPDTTPPTSPAPGAKMPFNADASAKPQPAKIRRAELTDPAIATAKAPEESAVLKATPPPTAPPPEPKEPPVEATPASAGSAPPAAESPTEIVIMSAPTHEAAATSPDPNKPATDSTPAPETPAPHEIVITSAPAHEAAAPPPETASQPPASQPDTVVGKPPASPEDVKAPASVAQPAATAAAPVSGFYDANAPKNSSNRPAVTLGVVGSPPAGAVVSPADEPGNASVNATTEPSPGGAEAAPPPQPDAQPIWPGNAEPNMEREKVVETGTFALPKEVPDPNQPLHSKQITPSAEDGFQEGQRVDCRKNITIGGLKGEKLVLGTPKWAADWIEKNQKRMLDLCFSDTPMQGARNYLIVFYTSSASTGAEVVNPVAPAPQGGSPASGVGTFTTSYGSTWHYFFDRNVGVTVNSSIDADQPQSQPYKLSYATAYTEEGVPVAQRWQAVPKKQIKLNPDDPNVRRESKKERHAREEVEHVADALLNQMVEEIEKL